MLTFFVTAPLWLDIWLIDFCCKSFHLVCFSSSRYYVLFNNKLLVEGNPWDIRYLYADQNTWSTMIGPWHYEKKTILNRRKFIPKRFCRRLFFYVLDEDLKLNSQVFHWPEQLQTIFDASSTKLQTNREKSEDEIKAKVKAFEEKLAGYEKEVDSFRKKEVKGFYTRFFIQRMYLDDKIAKRT